MGDVRRFFLGVLACAVLAGAAMSEETRLTVYVKSRGGKFVGTSMGGMRILIEDAHSGQRLAEGVTAGSTGDTGLIMNTAHEPGTSLTTRETAHYTAALDIERPRLVIIRARGPLAQAQAATEVSIRQWVLPGRDIVKGNAITLELPGFVVDVQSPPNHVKLKGTPQEVRIQANVTLMCGCGIKPGGLWDPADYQIQATIRHNGEFDRTVEMNYGGETSQFESEVELDAAGVYEITVHAFDSANGNVGLDRATVIVQEE